MVLASDLLATVGAVFLSIDVFRQEGNSIIAPSELKPGVILFEMPFLICEQGVIRPMPLDRIALWREDDADTLDRLSFCVRDIPQQFIFGMRRSIFDRPVDNVMKGIAAGESQQREDAADQRFPPN